MSAEKKNDPEKAKEVKDGEREDGKEEKETVKATSASMGNTESAKGKPKGVKEMPTKAKTAKGLKLMGKNSK